MHTIEIDSTVFGALESRASGFGRTPNDVLRELLGLNGTPAGQGARSTQQDAVLEFLGSAAFKALRDAEGKYLGILGCLFKHHKPEFASVEAYGRGRRLYFAQDPKKIQAAAKYANTKQIPGTPYYAMTTLDNQTKRKVLRYALELFGYPETTIALVLRTIPSSTRNGKGT